MSTAPGGGTVTMLFTDIEGSTRLARELGADWPSALSRHHAIMEAAIAGHDGVVENTNGDAFFGIFLNAQEGIGAAVEAQRELRAAEWPGPPIRVRMGLHTGEVQRAATGLVGIEVHRAARVAASAHGGQVLLTEATRALAGEGVETEDLGRHRLKDFPEPLRLFHLVLDGRCAGEFPAPKSLPVRPTNVPVLDTPIFGRGKELAEIHDRLLDGTRLMTITGHGGAGKTRLAIAAAENLLGGFTGGAWFVPLADITDARRLLSVLAETLAVTAHDEGTLRDALIERLRSTPTLLVLDNLEQLRHAAPELGELIMASPPLRVLATSQAPLRLSAERVLSLRPLELEHSRQLFIGTASRRSSDFDPAASRSAIDAICERLEGWPLAIELAAARTSLLTPQQVLVRLSDSVELLRVRDRDRPERQRSLQAAIEWSFGLLADADRDLCADLGQFLAPFTVLDAETLASCEVLDGLEELLELSFLRRVDAGTGETLFTMAQALREFTRAWLAEGAGLEGSRRRHAAWALAYARGASTDVDARDADALADHERVHRRLEDMYAALAWSRDADAELHLKLGAAVSQALAWPPAGPELETELAIAIERATRASSELVDVLYALALSRFYRGDLASCLVLLGRATGVCRDLDDLARTIATLLVSSQLGFDDDLPNARQLAHEALALAYELGDQAWIDRAVAGIAQIDVAAASDTTSVEPSITDALTRTRDFHAAVNLRHLWGDCALLRGDGPEAAARYAAAARALPLDEDPTVLLELQGVAMGLALAGRPELALEVERIADATGEHFNIRPRHPFWDRMRKLHLGRARAARPDYRASHPLDDLPASRQWALALADGVQGTATSST